MNGRGAARDERCPDNSHARCAARAQAHSLNRAPLANPSALLPNLSSAHSAANRSRNRRCGPEIRPYRATRARPAGRDRDAALSPHSRRAPTAAGQRRPEPCAPTGGAVSSPPDTVMIGVPAGGARARIREGVKSVDTSRPTIFMIEQDQWLGGWTRRNSSTLWADATGRVGRRHDRNSTVTRLLHESGHRLRKRNGSGRPCQLLPQKSSAPCSSRMSISGRERRKPTS